MLKADLPPWARTQIAGVFSRVVYALPPVRCTEAVRSRPEFIAGQQQTERCISIRSMRVASSSHYGLRKMSTAIPDGRHFSGIKVRRRTWLDSEVDSCPDLDRA